MTNPVRRIKQYYFETVQEIKKCSWPERPELIQSTLLVISALAFLSLVVFLFDSLFQKVILDWILGQG